MACFLYGESKLWEALAARQSPALTKIQGVLSSWKSEPPKLFSGWISPPCARFALALF